MGFLVFFVVPDIGRRCAGCGMVARHAGESGRSHSRPQVRI